MKKISNEEFIQLSKDKFGDLIDHNKTQLVDYSTKVTLYCKYHGPFTLKPSTHLNSKHGCTKCGALASPRIRAEKKKNTFLEDAFKVHGDTYTYERMDYKSGKDKIEITCRHHGYFWQSPQKHLSGQGCPDCAMYGYNTSRPGNFYILTNGEITKVGITHQQVKERMWQINKSHKSVKFKIVTTMFYQDGTIPRKLENACLSYLRSKYQQVQEVFDGSTECFLDVDLNDLLSFVTPIATQSELEQSSQPILA